VLARPTGEVRGDLFDEEVEGRGDQGAPGAREVSGEPAQAGQRP
jgi:hypothetical protein